MADKDEEDSQQKSRRGILQSLTELRKSGGKSVSFSFEGNNTNSDSNRSKHKKRNRRKGRDELQNLQELGTQQPSWTTTPVPVIAIPALSTSLSQQNYSIDNYSSSISNNRTSSIMEEGGLRGQMNRWPPPSENIDSDWEYAVAVAAEVTSPLHPHSVDDDAVMAAVMNEDQVRLAKLGYNQEVRRLFGTITSFGLAFSMVSAVLGIIPLYSFSLSHGGPIVMMLSWVIVGAFTLVLVGSMSEICAAYPTMGAVYYWSFRLGGDKFGPFASWTAGWCNLLGQIAGVACSGYACAEIISNMAQLSTGRAIAPSGLIGIYLVVLILGGVINSFIKSLLVRLCYFALVWQIVGVAVIIISMIWLSPDVRDPQFALMHYENASGQESLVYVCVIGCMAAASAFTGFESNANIAEETTKSYNTTPIGMTLAVITSLFLGFALIITLNFCIQQDISALVNIPSNQQAYTALWQAAVGSKMTMFFLFIVLIAIECSNFANITSASRLIYSFSRDGALPPFFYKLSEHLQSPLRAIWFSVSVAFMLGLPGLFNKSALNALFSLNAAGLYISYFVVFFLRVTVSCKTFEGTDFDLGWFSVPLGCLSCLWCAFMIIILCLPYDFPVTSRNMNYAPVAVGLLLSFAWSYWIISARYWFKCKHYVPADFDVVEMVRSYRPPPSMRL